MPSKNSWGAVKSTYEGKNKKNETFVASKLVLVISNWGFVRDQEGNPKFQKCTPHDVSIGFKLDSTAFRPADKSIVKPRYFDRNGASIPYPAFLSLMKDESFVFEYMSKLQKRFEEDTGRNLAKEFEAHSDRKKKSSGQPGKSKALSTKALRKKYVEQFPELAVSDEGEDEEEEEREDDDEKSEEEDDSDDARLLSDSETSDVGQSHKKVGRAQVVTASISNNNSDDHPFEGAEGDEVDAALLAAAAAATVDSEASKVTERGGGKKRVSRVSKDDSSPAKVTRGK